MGLNSWPTARRPPIATLASEPVSALAVVPPAPARVGPIYAVEALASTGGTLFTIGIPFYTQNNFGWGSAENFRLAAAQGAIYITGALLANVLTQRVRHQRAVVLLHAIMALACVLGMVAGMHASKSAVTAVLLGYTFISAICWPILESLVVLGTSGKTMARRLGGYNIVWPIVGAITLAVSGTVIDYFPTGVFLFPAIAHVLAVVCASRATPQSPATPLAVSQTNPDTTATPSHPEPEPELLRVRTLALWVSRLGLPATYAVIYGLMPLMPSLPAVSRFDTKTQTVVSSAWLVARWITFVILGLTTWWHTRPRVMVLSALLMLVAFLGITLAPSQLLGSAATPTIDLVAILCWQVLLGVALGVIYSGSLYFGLVLSEGSTEHSGYHEALIGLGWILGPAAGALMQVARPGDLQAGVFAVGSVIALSVAGVVAAAIIAARRAIRQTAGLR